MIIKIGLRLTFHPLRVFLNLEIDIIATIIIATRTLMLIEEDTYNQAVDRGVNNHFIQYRTFHTITAYVEMMPRH